MERKEKGKDQMGEIRISKNLAWVDFENQRKVKHWHDTKECVYHHLTIALHLSDDAILTSELLWPPWCLHSFKLFLQYRLQQRLSPIALPGDGLTQNNQVQMLFPLGSSVNKLIIWSLGWVGGPKIHSFSPVGYKHRWKLTQGAGGQKESRTIGSSLGPGLPPKTGWDNTAWAEAAVELFLFWF